MRAARLGSLAAAAVIAAGCGKSAAQQFRDTLAPIQRQVQAERSQIAATLQSVRLGDRRGAQVLDQQIATLSDSLAAMHRIKAPGATAQRAFVTYQTANRGLVASLYRVAAVVAHGNQQQLGGASTAATDAAGAVQRASDALDSALG